MSEYHNAQRVYKPGRQSIVYYIVDVSSLVAGAFFIITFHSKAIYIIIGILMCVLGIWQFLSTHAVRGTYFVTTHDEVIMVRSGGTASLKWNEISDALIRKRPSIIQFGRFDRLVVLTDHTDRMLPLNTSILTRDDEEYLLNIISKKVQCPIREVSDGLIITNQRKK